MVEQRNSDSDATIHTELLARITMRDASAFQQFYDTTSQHIFALGMQMLGNPSQAQDLLQDVYLKVWYGADTFSRKQAAPMTWLVSIARNRAIDLLRNKANQTLSLVDDVGEAVAPTLADVAGDTQLQDCLDELDGEQRQSIFAAFFQGLTHSEIALRFAEPIGTVKSRIRRGLTSLKGCLER